MKDDLFNQVGKRLPYKESDDYVSGLIERCAEEALKNPKKKRHTAETMWLRIAGVAAVMALVVTVAINLWNQGNASDMQEQQSLAMVECDAESVNESAPLNEVLTEMTYDQLSLVSYYYTDDIPEY